MPPDLPSDLTTPAPPQGQSVAPAALLQAARRLLRPLARLMMRSGVTFPVLADTLRTLFIDVALTDMLTDPKSRTDSRVSLITGVHRKEIKRLRSLPADRPETPEIVTLASQIVARWLGTSAYTDADGHPRILSRQPQPDDPHLAFETLVQLVTTDVRPRAVLDDLVSHGVVSLLEGDRVRLNTQAFIPRPGGAEQIFYFARNLHDHLAAASTNIAQAEAPFLDRSVHYDDLTAEQARQLRAYAREAAMRVLLDINRKALELLDNTPPGETGDRAVRQRVNVGVYLYQEDDGDNRTDDGRGGGL
jgi:Family of unknown function (DUF6502)